MSDKRGPAPVPSFYKKKKDQEFDDDSENEDTPVRRSLMQRMSTRAPLPPQPKGDGKDHQRHLPRLPSSPMPEQLDPDEIARREHEFVKMREKAKKEKSKQKDSSSANPQTKTLPRLPSSPMPNPEDEHELQEKDRLFQEKLEQERQRRARKEAKKSKHRFADRISARFGGHKPPPTPPPSTLQSREAPPIPEKYQKMSSSEEEHSGSSTTDTNEIKHRGMMSSLVSSITGGGASSSKTTTKAKSNDKKNGKVESDQNPKRPGVLAKSKEKYVPKRSFERGVIAALAVLLLWSSSLQVCRSIVRAFIPSPQFDNVRSLTINALDRTETERNRYKTCSQRRVDTCNETFTGDLEDEKDLAYGVVDSNRAKLDSYFEYLQSCSDSVDATVFMIDRLINEFSEDLELYAINPSTWEDDCGTIEEEVERQRRALGALDESDNFRKGADLQVRELVDSLNARTNYDQEYLANKTKELFDIGIDLGDMIPEVDVQLDSLNDAQNQMIACSRVDGIYNDVTCPTDPTVPAQMEMWQNAVQTRYKEIHDDVMSRLESFRSLILPFYNFYNLIRNALAATPSLRDAWNAIASIPLPSTGASTPSFVSFSSIFGPMEFNGFTNLMPSIQADFNVQISAFDADYERIKESMRKTRDEIRDSLTSWQITAFEDYDPPSLRAEETENEWVEKEENFDNSMRDELASVRQRSEAPSSSSEDFRPRLNTTFWSNRAGSLIQNLDPRNWDFFVYDDLSFQDILDQWFQLQNLAFTFDYIYRTLQSISLIRKYWNVSAVTVYPADVRFGSVKKAVKAPPSSSPAQMMAYYATHPVTLLILALVFLSLIISAFLELYLPFFDEYVNGCAGTSTDGSGTFITENGYSLAFRYSASDGDAISSAEIDRINVLRELECTEHTERTLEAFLSHQNEYSSLLRRITRISELSAVFNTCVNGTAIDEVHTSIASGSNFTSLVEAMGNADCNATLFQPLEESIFDCSAIRQCDIGCRGPNAAALRSSVWNGGCTVEWWIHASLMTFLMSLAVFVALNISRQLILRGIVHVFWNHIASNKFVYLGTARYNGALLKPEWLEKEGKSMKDAIRQELKVSIRRFEKSGFLFLACGIIINLPWLIALIVLRSNMAFDPQ